MQHAPDVTLPRTAADALQLWGDHKPVPAFRVASEGASQTDIWAYAFGQIEHVERPMSQPLDIRLTLRECEVAQELRKAALGHGYARMVQINLAGGGEPIFVTKPQPVPAT